MRTKNLFERMKPDAKKLFDLAEKVYPKHAEEVKYDLSNKYYINDITLNTAFILCSFIWQTSLDYNHIAANFESIIPDTIK